MPPFVYSTPIPAKIWGVPFWSRSVLSGSAEKRKPRLISHEIIVEVFQPMLPQYLNVTDRQTNGRTICRNNTALCVASRGKTELFL